ncbi:MAG: phage tail tube protein [bacterium]
MATAQVSSQYFSGQGVLLLAERTVGGAATGFLPVGNVSALTLGVGTQVYQHKESQSGTRAVDLEIIQEISANVSMTLESLNEDNLALALYGTGSTVAASSVADENITGYHDKWTALSKVDVSSVAVAGSGGTPSYVENTDYVVDTAAGAIKVLSTGSISDGATLEVDFDYAAQEEVLGLMSGSAPIRWARFHGLNTADNDNPVVIDIFKLSVQPLQEIALINDEIAQMTIEAKALSDATKVTGSKFFRIRQVATN